MQLESASGMLLLVQSACQPLSPVLEAPLALHRLTRSRGVAADASVKLQTTGHAAQGEADGSRRITNQEASHSKNDDDLSSAEHAVRGS